MTLPRARRAPRPRTSSSSTDLFGVATAAPPGNRRGFFMSAGTWSPGRRRQPARQCRAGAGGSAGRGGRQAGVFEPATRPGPVRAGFLLQPSGLQMLWKRGLPGAARVHAAVVRRLPGTSACGGSAAGAGEHGPARCLEPDRRLGAVAHAGAVAESVYAPQRRAPVAIHPFCSRWLMPLFQSCHERMAGARVLWLPAGLPARWPRPYAPGACGRCRWRRAGIIDARVAAGPA